MGTSFFWESSIRSAPSSVFFPCSSLLCLFCHRPAVFWVYRTNFSVSEFLLRYDGSVKGCVPLPAEIPAGVMFTVGVLLLLPDSGLIASYRCVSGIKLPFLQKMRVDTGVATSAIPLSDEFYRRSVYDNFCCTLHYC